MYGTIVVGVQLIVKAMVVLALRLPEVPLMVTVAAPGAAEPLAVNVSTLLPVVGLVAKAAVTPLGRPEAASVTLPVNPFWPVTVMVDFPEAPWATVSEAGEAPRVKLGAGIVRASVVEAVSEPEVPLMVIVALPIAAELLAVSVSTLLPVVGFGTNDAVTPLGKPVADSVTSPVNPFRSFTVTVLVPLLP